MKKTLVTVATTAVLSSSFVANAYANTHKVESGESLWSISRKYDMSITTLKNLNKLKTDTIFPNQLLQVADGSNNPVETSTSSSKPAPQIQTVTEKKYIVKSGDTLSAIANRHSITLSELQKWNNIHTHLIYPGQTLVVGEGSTGTTVEQSAPNETETAASPPKQTSSSTHTVKSGDTLSHISLKYNLSVQDIKRLNNLSKDIIYVGQVLKVGKTEAVQQVAPTEAPAANDEINTAFNTNKLITQAKAQMGTPYVWGGSTTAGFDCSGFIYYAFNKSGVNVIRTSSEGYYNRSYYVNKPAIGDLVFFENTYKKGISHLGIYVGDNKFIHAGDNGVEIASLSNSYWKSKFDGFKRFYEL